MFLDENRVFFCGGSDDGIDTQDTYVYDLSRVELTQKADMRQARMTHGTYSYNVFIYVFGGSYESNPTLKNEVYSIDSDVWDPLPNLPEDTGMTYVTVTRRDDSLYVTGKGSSRIVRFGMESEAMTILPFKLPLIDENHKIFTVGHHIMIIELNRVYQLNEYGIKTEEYITEDDHQPVSWLAGPPIYWQNKVFFSGNTIDDNHLYCYDPEEPDIGVFISRYNAFTNTD